MIKLRLYNSVSKHLLFIIGFVVFAFLYYSTINSHGMLMWDEAEYANLSWNIYNGGVYDNALRPPVIAFGGALFIFLTGLAEDVQLKLFVLLMALLSLILVYSYLYKFRNAASALLAFILLGFFPSFWMHTSYFLSEIPFVFFFAGAILFFYSGIYKGSQYFYVSWAMTGFAFLTRYTALLIGLIMILFFIALIFSDPKRCKGLLKDKHFYIAPLIGLVVLLPWLIHQQLAHGNFLVGFKIASQQLAIYMPNISMPWHFYFKGIPEMLGIPGMIITFLGILGVVYRRDRLGIHMLLVILFLIAWFTQYRYKELRLITSFLPFWALIGGIGIEPIIKRFLNGIKLRISILTLAILLGLYSYRSTKEFFMYYTTLGYPHFAQAMNYIKNNSGTSDVIMGASVPQIQWYSKRKAVGLPGNESDLATKLEDCEWLVFVNFERGQPSYVIDKLLFNISKSAVESNTIRLFGNQQSFTFVIPASYFNKILRK